MSLIKSAVRLILAQ